MERTIPKEAQIEVKKIVPVIGNISTGKSTILNYFIGIQLLQSGGNLTTRFILIIRNSNRTVPILSHIVRKKEDGKEFYVKDEKDDFGRPKEYIGEDQIKNKIEEINKKNYKAQKNENNRDYTKQLYLIEVKIKNIENEQFKQNFDLADIPGLNSHTIKNNKVGDLNEIFYAINDLVYFGFLIFDSSQYKDELAITVVKEFKSEGKTVDNIATNGSLVEYNFRKKKIIIKNFLIILNKIDLVDDEKATLREFKAYLLRNDLADLLSETNCIISLDCTRLNDEENCLNSFENYFTFLLKTYLTKKNQMSVISYIKNEICYGYYMNHKFEKRKTFKNIEEIFEPEEEMTRDQKKIVKECIKKANESIQKKVTNIKIELDEADDETCIENIKVINVLRSIFTEKKYDYLYKRTSTYKKSLDKYFNKDHNYYLKLALNQNDNSIENTGQKIENVSNLCFLSQVKESIEMLRDFYEKNVKSICSTNYNINCYYEEIKKLEQIIINRDKVRVTFCGTYNSGKSSLINSLVGREIVEVGKDETTKKPILIQNSSEEIPQIFKAKCEVIIDSHAFKHFNFSINGPALAKGDEAVKDFINCQNKNTGLINNNEQDDEFYILKTKIKFFDEPNLPEIIQENKYDIEFLDMPGWNTNSIPKEGGLLENLLHRTSIFIITIDPTVGSSQSESYRKDLKNNLKRLFYMQSSIEKDLTKPFLFICNKFDKKEAKDFDEEICQEDLKEAFNITEKKDMNFTICKYSAKSVLDMYEKKDSYKTEKFIEERFEEFTQKLYSKKTNLLDFLINNLKEDIENNFVKEFDKRPPNQNITKELKELLLKKELIDPSKIDNPENEEKISEISSHLSFAIENIHYLRNFEKGLTNNLQRKLSEKISHGLEIIKSGYSKNLYHIISNIEAFFRYGILPCEREGENCEGVKQNKVTAANKFLEEIMKIFDENNVKETFISCQNDINNELNNESNVDFDKIEESLKKKLGYIERRMKRLENDLRMQKTTMETKLKEKTNKFVEILVKELGCVSNDNIKVGSTAGDVVKSAGLLLGVSISGIICGITGIPLAIIFSGGPSGPVACLLGLGFLALVNAPLAGAIAIGSTIWMGVCYGSGLATMSLYDKMKETWTERKRKVYREALEKIKTEFSKNFNPMMRQSGESFDQAREYCKNNVIKTFNLTIYKAYLSSYDIKIKTNALNELIRKINTKVEKPNEFLIN